MSEKSVASLERVAADDQQSEEVRRRVIDALGKSLHDAAAAALFKLMQPKGLIERGATSALRDAAAEALRASPAAKAAALFQEGLTSSTWRVRKACERAAGTG